MKMPASPIVVFFAATVITVGVSGMSARAEDSPTVIELFTSQGCNSCPPADAYLAELAERPDVLVLSWFVDYWNYLGWKDTFGRSAYTMRQKAYNRSLGKLGVYTPQMVINGVVQSVGSRKKDVEKLLALQVRQHPGRIPIEISRNGDRFHVALGAHQTDRKATVRAIGYIAQASVAIHGGELRGKTLHYVNVVRTVHKLGEWTGVSVNYNIAASKVMKAGADSIAVLVQYGDTGPVIAVADIARPDVGG